MSLEELHGITFFSNQNALQKAMDDIRFDKYESELNRIFEDEVIKEHNNDNVF